MVRPVVKRVAQNLAAEQRARMRAYARAIALKGTLDLRINLDLARERPGVPRSTIG